MEKYLLKQKEYNLGLVCRTCGHKTKIPVHI